MEAELQDDITDFPLTTEIPATAKKNDFTNFTTYVSFSADNLNKSLRFHFQPRQKDSLGYYFWVHARCGEKEKKSSMRISLDGIDYGSIQTISADHFEWYCLFTKKKALHLAAVPEQDHLLEVYALDKALQIDKIILSVKPGLSKNTKER